MIANSLLARVPEVPMPNRCAVQFTCGAVELVAGARPHGEIVNVGDWVSAIGGPNDEDASL